VTTTVGVDSEDSARSRARRDRLLRLRHLLAERFLVSPGRVAMSWALLGGLVVLIVSAALASNPHPYAWEEVMTDRLIDLPGGSTAVLRAVMLAGNRLAVAGLALVFLIADRPRRAAIALLSGWGAWLAAALAKGLLDRPRPGADVLGFSPEEFVSGPGYPSSHAAVAVALAVVVLTAGGLPRSVKVLAVVAAVLTGLARVHLVVHWPLDIVGGMAVGVLVAGLAVVVLDPAPVPSAWPGVGFWPPMPGLDPRPTDPALVLRPALRTATFNIRNGRALDGRHVWPLRRRATAAAITALDADLIGLQEVYAFQRRWLGRQLPDRGWVGAGRTDGIGRGEQCPITWRPSRLILEEWEVRWFSDRPDEPGSRFAGARAPRLATLARFRDRASNQCFGVANAHLDSSRPADRVRSAELLVAWMAEAEVPWLVLGDLNDVPDSRTLDVLESSGLLSVGPDDGRGTIHQFTGRTDGKRLDHVLISDRWSAGPADVVAVPGSPLASDHWPLVVDLRPEPART